MGLTLLALFLAGWVAVRTTRHLVVERTTQDLEDRATLLRDILQDRFTTLSSTHLDSLAKRWGQAGRFRLTFVAPDGRVLGDSHAQPWDMEKHADRPEIIRALSGSTGFAHRKSPTLKEEIVYLALPVRDNGAVVGVIRASLPATVTKQMLNEIYSEVIISGLVIATLVVAAGYFVFQRISRPLIRIRNGALRFARGDLEHKLPVPNSRELGSLAEVLNQMARDLSDRLGAITQQRNELEAVLSGMVEGVVAMDLEERILRMNRAAVRLLGVTHREILGHHLQEVVVNPDIQRFVARVLDRRQQLEEEIALHNGRIYLQAHGALLRDAAGRDIGVLVVLNDVTRLRRLENLRKEFVANVSHELRTPITSIKGAVETLRDGAINDPEDARRFLDITVRQADRLNAIIEDLLNLSRLEQEAEGGGIPLEPGDLNTVLAAAASNCEFKAREKDLHLDIINGEAAITRLNAPILEQAIVNLLDNAINYSPKGGTVQAGVEAGDGELIIYVKDQGCGIPAEHHNRVFERFYRVDKTRSRHLGGTGLGLAIVKHIALAHKGSVSLSSAPGQGSTFRLHLPRIHP